MILLAACVFPTDSDDSAAAHALTDLVDLSVNAASAGGAPLVLHTDAGAAPVGGFNGSGTGNKAIAGVPGLDGTPLADLTGLAIETTLTLGSQTPYTNAILDLDCTGSTLRLLVMDATVATVTMGTTTRYAWAPDAPQWKAVGGLDELLPGHLESTGGTLTDVLARYPGACLRDADTGDGGMPAGVVTSAVMVILGDSVTVDENEHRVSAVEVGATRWE